MIEDSQQDAQCKGNFIDASGHGEKPTARRLLHFGREGNVSAVIFRNCLIAVPVYVS